MGYYSNKYKKDLKTKKNELKFIEKFKKMSPEKQEKFLSNLVYKLGLVEAQIQDLKDIDVGFKNGKELSSDGKILIQLASFFINGIASGVLVGCLSNPAYGLLAGLIGSHIGGLIGMGICEEIEDKTFSNFFKRIKENRIYRKIKKKEYKHLKLARKLELVSELSNSKAKIDTPSNEMPTVEEQPKQEEIKIKSQKTNVEYAK